MRVFGLTGGIASGKSTVARLLAERGLPMVDADQLAREAVAPGSLALEQIVGAFGEGVLAADGSLDRKAVAARVFSDAEQRRLLNSIVHPRVAELSRERFAEHAARGDELIGYEVPLLFENGLDAVFRPVVLVALKPEQQQQRLMARDGLDQDAAQARLAAQWPLERKLAGADFVLWNEGSLAELQLAVEALIPRLRAFSVDGT